VGEKHRFLTTAAPLKINAAEIDVTAAAIRGCADHPKK
jgi:hypothetical protein